MIRVGDYVKVRMKDGYEFGVVERVIPMLKRHTELEDDYNRVLIKSGRNIIDVAEDQVEPIS